MASLSPYSGTLGRRLAAHLLRRTTFNITRERITEFAAYTVDQALDELFNFPNKILEEPIDPGTGLTWINSSDDPTSSNGQLRKYVSSWWIHEALHDTSIRHKMMYFLFTDFTVGNLNYSSEIGYDYIKLLDEFAVGNMEDFAYHASLSNAMLIYLDNTNNNKNNPNENYAREFLELFTIGKGPQIGEGDYTNYTELDVQMAAKVLTGFKKKTDRSILDADTGLPMGYAAFNKHDLSDKTFSYAFQNTTITAATDAEDMHRELKDMISMVFSQDETARYICRKLYRFFVARDITDEIETDIIEPLASSFKDADYDLEIAVKELLKSQHFYDEDDSINSDEIIGGLIKSPLELILQVLSYFKIEIPDPLTDSSNHYKYFYRRTMIDVILSLSAQNIFDPDTVAGFPAYYQEPDYDKNWFNAATIVARYKIPEILIKSKRILLSGNNIGGVRIKMPEFLGDSSNVSDPANANTLIDELLSDLFAEPVDNGRKQFFRDEILLDSLSLNTWNYEWQNFVDTGDDENILIPLNNLFQAILYSQEFQCN